jgi:CDP-glucose 4,6-dehydratase
MGLRPGGLEIMDLKYLFPNLSGKKILVTGHTGFKGSWLSMLLHKCGAEIVGIALDPRTENDNFNLADIKSIVKDIRADIRDFSAIERIVKEEKPEVVFHLAAQPLVMDSYESPLETYSTNIMGTANILESIRSTDSVQSAIFITTDKVYHNNEWLWPYREDDRLGGHDPYSSSKSAAEIVISSYRDSFFGADRGVSISSARAGNVIGGGDWSPNRILPDCIRSIEKNQSIEIRSPQAIRPWQHVLEPLVGYLMLAEKMMNNPINYSQAWNFGPDSENVIPVKNLVESVIKYYGHGKWTDVSDPSAFHEAQLLNLDINKARHLLSWRPVLNIEKTIQMTVEWYKHYHTQDMEKFCMAQVEEYFHLWKLTNEN